MYLSDFYLETDDANKSLIICYVVVVVVEQVFDDAQISSEEYELLKDLIIPLGRAPQLATQSGG